jgi:ArsR family transcriptional regulator
MPPEPPRAIVDLRSTIGPPGLGKADLHEPLRVREGERHVSVAFDTTVEQDVAVLAKALGHPARVRIMRLLLAHDACYCGQLVDELSLAQATVSQHLKVLKGAGLIVGEIERPRTCYCASRERLAELYELVGGILDEAVELAEDRRRECD